MKIAAIDIGSNAIRLQINKVLSQDGLISFKRLEYIRYPMQLGSDVFKYGKISKIKAEKVLLLLRSYKGLMDLYEIEGYRAVATSAMRESANGEEVTAEIQSILGLHVEIISGNEEAHILKNAIVPYLQDGNYLHIDVGGGSTELNVFKDRHLVDSKSIKIGSLRKLKSGEKKEIQDDLKSWIKKSPYLTDKKITSVGTGGNINKLYKLAGKQKSTPISLTELRAIKAYVNEFPPSLRESTLKLNPDRAQVIIPAANIYISLMQLIKSDHMIVPRVGLKDGIMYLLYESVSGERLTEIEFVDE